MPGSWVWGRASEHSRGDPPAQFASDVPAINRVETDHPRQIEPSDAPHPLRVRIVVEQLQGVGLVEVVLQSVFERLRVRSKAAPPVTLEIPVRTRDPHHVSLHRQTLLVAASGG